MRLGEICLRHGVYIISDEIHCDLLFDGAKHIPIASLSEELGKVTATFIAPSKTYNIAGLHASVAIIPNPELREKYTKVRAGTVSDPNMATPGCRNAWLTCRRTAIIYMKLCPKPCRVSKCIRLRQPSWHGLIAGEQA